LTRLVIVSVHSNTVAYIFSLKLNLHLINQTCVY